MIIYVDEKTKKGLIKLAISMSCSVDELCKFILGSEDIKVEFSADADKREVSQTLPFKQQHTNQEFPNQLIL